MMEFISKRTFGFRLFLILIGIIIFGSVNAQTTTKSYVIELAGFEIGDMKVEEIKRNEIIEYNLKSLVSFWLFGKINVELTINSIYKNGKLISSDSKSISNRGSFYSKIKWNGTSYLVDSHSYKFDNKISIENLVPFSIVKFYFQEPIPQETMISETFGLTSIISKKENGVYQIEINGNRNKFVFINGELDHALMQNPIKNYVIKRIY